MSTSEYVGEGPSGLLVKQTQGEEYHGSGDDVRRATGPEIDPAVRAHVWRLAVGLSVVFWVAVALLGLRGCWV